MFGAFRFLLAVMVLITHLGGVEIVAGVAVWGFFMLSGFLMTAVLNGKYGFDRAGLGRFAMSRGLRLFPTYWISLLLTLLVFALPSAIQPHQLNSSWASPQNFGELLANLLIVGHTAFGLGRVEHALSPSAWAIDVEILMYICSAIWLSRTERAARHTAIFLTGAYPLLWVAAKYLARDGSTQLANELLYSFLPAALLPYAVGAWLWHARQRIPGWAASKPAAVAAILGILVCIFGIARVSVTAGYTMAVPCLAVLMAGLSQVRATGARASIDSFLGLMAYPSYLLHWLGGYIVMSWAPSGLSVFEPHGRFLALTPVGFALAVAATLGMSAAFAYLLEAPIERIRHRFAVAAPGDPKRAGHPPARS